MAVRQDPFGTQLKNLFGEHSEIDIPSEEKERLVQRAYDLTNDNSAKSTTLSNLADVANGAIFTGFGGLGGVCAQGLCIDFSVFTSTTAGSASGFLYCLVSINPLKNRMAALRVGFGSALMYCATVGWPKFTYDIGERTGREIQRIIDGTDQSYLPRENGLELVMNDSRNQGEMERTWKGYFGDGE